VFALTPAHPGERRLPSGAWLASLGEFDLCQFPRYRRAIAFNAGSRLFIVVTYRRFSYLRSRSTN
jgi:hypothetical protein